LTDGAMLTFILRRLRASTVMLAPYDKLQRRLLKSALGLFGSADNAPRVQAILLVRQMAMDLPQPALDNCLKVGGGKL
jgi:nucleolar complex protein 2